MSSTEVLDAYGVEDGDQIDVILCVVVSLFLSADSWVPVLHC